MEMRIGVNQLPNLCSLVRALILVYFLDGVLARADPSDLTAHQGNDSFRLAGASTVHHELDTPTTRLRVNSPLTHIRHQNTHPLFFTPRHRHQKVQYPHVMQLFSPSFQLVSSSTTVLVYEPGQLLCFIQQPE